MYSVASAAGIIYKNVMDGACNMHGVLKGACRVLVGESQKVDSISDI
jgi:hypothetical protein